MKELEDTKCEVRRTIDLQFSIWDRLNTSTEEEGVSPLGLSGNGCSNVLGNFFEDAAYAWLSCGPRLVVVNVKTGANISSWTFRHRVTCVSQFPAQPGEIPLLLVGLDNGANKLRDSFGLLCIFDCTSSQVLRAIRMPAGVEQACVVVGGADWEDFGEKRINSVLGESNGMACVSLRNLDHLMIDLRRTSWEGPETNPLADENNPVELNFTERNNTTTARHKSSREKHNAYNLMNSRLEGYIGFNREEFESSTLYQESLTSSLVCSRKIGCLVSGCLGRIIIWQTDGDVRWISPPLDESISITHLALLEPTDDPRPFCYLWSACQEETRRSPSTLRMYAMLFERKYTDKGLNSYYNLEADPSVKFELELDDNDRITNLCPIVRESNPEQTDTYKRGEDSILLISTSARAFLFDLNQWYKEQMPRTIDDCNNPNAIIACYRTGSEIHGTTSGTIVNCSYIPETLKEFPCNSLSPPEELFYPNSLSLDWIDLSPGHLTFWTTRGLQKELLREMSLIGPIIMIEPTETFNRCSSVGLVRTTVGDPSVNPSKDAQREILLSLCLEQRWTNFLLKCAKEWSDGSASYLFHAFLRWGMQRASTIKLNADRLTVPLYDQSGTGIGDAEVKKLRFYSQQLECITNVVTNLEIDSVDLTNERRALRRVTTYLQVLLWFYDVQLLPEKQENENDAEVPMPFSLRIPYPYEKLATMYRDKRRQYSDGSAKNVTEREQDTFIDELVTRECFSLKAQWEREGGELSLGGNYPPSSLQSLLRSYLVDCHSNESNEMDNKHQITIYLLMDLEMLLKASCPSVNQLIKYPSAFKLSPSLIQLTQALWYLDHEDYNDFLDIMTGQLVADSDVKDWHHRLVLRTLIRNNRNKLALIYLRVRKPPLSSLDDQSTVISLSVEHGLVQSAFHRRPPAHYDQLLTSFFRSCKLHDRLDDILHLALNHEEEEAFVKFLESEKTEDTRLLYYLQRCRYAEASNVYPVGYYAARGSYSRSTEKTVSLTIFNAYNATLPEVTRKFCANVGRKVTDVETATRYPRPMSHRKSRVKTRDIHEIVMRKARETFLRCDRSRVPFVSAPCDNFASRNVNNDANSVLFVERLAKSRRKRSLNEMHDDDNATIERDENRKRRKTSDVNDTGDNAEREIGASMVFDTPLVKRKNQMINGRGTSIETPHSILKIRQLIRDSTSPGQSDKGTFSVIDESTSNARERKRRQIRFSIGKRSNDSSITREDEEIAKNIRDSDATSDDSDAKNLVAKNEEIEDEEDIEEAYYSPETSGKSYYEATLLNDASLVSMSFSGPRPRPSLRRSNESTASDFVKNTPVPTESPRTTSEFSFTINDRSKNNVLSSRKSRIPDVLSETAYTASILSSDTSFERTLSNEEIASRSFFGNAYSVTEHSVEKCRDNEISSITNEKSEHFSRYGRTVTRRSSIRRTSRVRDESTDEIDEDKNSEILMEVDGFGLDRESSNQSATKHTWNNDNNSDRTEIIGLSAIESVDETNDLEDEKNFAQRNVSERDENYENEEMDQNDSDSLLEISLRLPEDDIRKNAEIDDDDVQDNEKREDQVRNNVVEVSEDEDEGNELRETVGNSTKSEILLANISENRDIAIDEREIGKSTEDYDDELLALNYDEDDNDEVFESLQNSTAFAGSKSSSEKSVVPIDIDDVDEEENDNEAAKKSKNSSINNGFYEIPRVSRQETNITDDESSRSVDGSASSFHYESKKPELEKTISVEKMQRDIVDEVSNMTNDDSESSFDSSLFTVQKPIETSIKVTNLLDNAENRNSEYHSGRESSLLDRMESQNFASDLEKIVDTPEVSEQLKSSSGTGETLASNATERDASEITNDATEIKERNELNVDESSVARREDDTIENITSTKRSESPAVEIEVTTPLRMTRSRRASSVMQEQSPVIESPLTRSSTTGRLRRASSLAKDIFVTENVSRATTNRLRRSVSLAKELTPVKSLTFDETSSNTNEELPIGRRTRRGASVQKEISLEKKISEEEEEKVIPIASKTKLTRSTSKLSLTEDNVDESMTTRKSTRTKKIIATSKDNETTIAPKRLTRASSLVKEVTEKLNEEPMAIGRTTRKRGGSVPKETTLETGARVQRTRRGSSLAKDIITKETSDNAEDKKRGRTTPSFRDKTTIVERTKSSSPTTSTRSRLSSITSIPEEMSEDIEDEESDSEIFSAGISSEDRKIISRERRAMSVDLSRIDVKPRTRASSLKSAIIDEPIEEESFDNHAVNERNAKLTKKVPARRKRTTSATSARELKVVLEKLPKSRTRKTSQKRKESETFAFSPPDKPHDRPDDDEKGISEMPNYVFSPPHTRSRHINSQTRRNVSENFIPIMEEERAQAKRALESCVDRPRITLCNPTRNPIDFYGPRKIFSFTKRSKSASDESTGRSQRDHKGHR